MTHKSSPKIPPNLSLHVLWLKLQIFISASFWGLGTATDRKLQSRCFYVRGPAGVQCAEMGPIKKVKSRSLARTWLRSNFAIPGPLDHPKKIVPGSVSSKSVLGKGVGNNKNASGMRQKCVKNAPQWVLFYWEKCVSPKMRGTPLGGTPFGRYRLWPDPKFL